jgi:gliding motility-associated-like protein
MANQLLKKSFLFFLILVSWKVKAQCPKFFDGNTLLSSNPYWISCSGLAFDINVVSDTSFGSYAITWGDGSSTTSGSSYTANSIIPHSYVVATDTFLVTITTSSPSCIVTGVVVMEKAVNSVIQIPLGSASSVCNVGNMSFINLSTDASPTTVFTWNFGDGSTLLSSGLLGLADTITHSFSSGTVNCQTTVTLTAQNYCSAGIASISQINPISVYEKDQVSFFPDAFIKCFPTALFTFTNTTISNCGVQGNSAQRYEKWNFHDYWNLGRDSITNWIAWPTIIPQTISYLSTGVYSITLLDSSFCGIDSANATVVILNPPAANIAAPIDSACIGSVLTFNNLSSAGYTYKWNFGDNTIYTSFPFGNVNHTYLSAGNYIVTVVAMINGGNSSCRDSARLQVCIMNPPTSLFTRTPGFGCTNVSVACTDNSIGATNYDWKKNGVTFSTLQNPPNQNYSVGNYTITLTVTNSIGCTHASQQLINVLEGPLAVFSNQSVCQNSLTQFTNNSTFPVGDSILNWLWNFGDGTPTSSNTNATHIYTTLATVTVTLNVSTANCVDSSSVIIVVNPKPVAIISAFPLSGCSPLAVNFGNSSIDATIYQWDFGNTLTSVVETPGSVYLNTLSTNINYTATLIASSAAGCSDTAAVIVTVLGKPQANFSSFILAQCSPASVNFTNSSSSAISYLWIFGDSTANSTVLNPTHIFNNSSFTLQNYSVSLIASNANGCVDTLNEIIQVYPKGIPVYGMLADSGCAPLTVNVSANPGAISYKWDFGDGNSSGLMSAMHQYNSSLSFPVNYTLTFISINSFGCVDTVVSEFVVLPTPLASFIALPTHVYVPISAVNTINQTINGDNYLWDFGDGGTSIDFSPAYFYAAEGNYQITLYATNLFGCADTFFLPNLINAEVQTDVVVPNAFSPNANAENDGVYDPTAINNDIFHPLLIGAKKFEMRIFNRWGELLFITEDIAIGWNGYYKGKLCTQDVYIWKITAETINDKKINKAGDVLLIR